MSTPVLTRDGVEIPIPPLKMRLMDEPPEEFVRRGVLLAERVQEWGLADDHEILDVGCSVGRLATGLLAGTDFRGRYVGFDVARKRIRWARNNLMPIAPRFAFRHLDVYNARYNKRGEIAPEDTRFPARDDGFHMAVLFSVFTHFYRADIEVYLRELRRVLRPGGQVLCTWFLFDEDSRDAAVTSVHHPMRHTLDEHTIYRDLEDPLAAIAYEESFVRSLVAEAGLEVSAIRNGRWNRDPGWDQLQDLVVLRKPG